MNTRRAAQKKATGQRTKRVCKCIHHDYNESKVVDLSYKKVPIKTVSRLIEKGVITSKIKFICERCIELFGGENNSARVI